MNDELRTPVQLAVRAVAPFLSPSLQSVLALLDSGLDVRPSAIIEERLREFLECWRTELRRPLENGYHPQFLEAQSFTQLIILTIEATVRERLGEKRRMYGRLLARADTEQWGDARIGRVEEALDALTRMSEGDLRVLNLIISHVESVNRRGIKEETQYLKAAQVSIHGLQNQLGDLSTMGVKTYVTRLERLGLLLTDPNITGDFGSGSYVPTHLLDELMELTRK